MYIANNSRIKEILMYLKMKSKERFSKEFLKIPGRYVCHENKELQLLKSIEFQTNGQYKYILK